MKKQTNNSHRAAIAITFLTMLLTITACNERKEPTHNSAVSETRVSPSKIDIHTAVMTGNMEALKRHIAAGSNLNEKDPLGGSSPLISATHNLKTEIEREDNL